MQPVWGVLVACSRNVFPCNLFPGYSQQSSGARLWRQPYQILGVAATGFRNHAVFFRVVGSLRRELDARKTQESSGEGFSSRSLSLRRNVCKRVKDRGFAESTENELPIDGMPEHLRCKYYLKPGIPFRRYWKWIPENNRRKISGRSPRPFSLPVN